MANENKKTPAKPDQGGAGNPPNRNPNRGRETEVEGEERQPQSGTDTGDIERGTQPKRAPDDRTG